MDTYPYNINSILAKNPGLPEILGDINLNQAVVEGQALNRQHLRHSKATAYALRGRKGKCCHTSHRLNILIDLYMNLAQYPGLTEDVVESAEWRADVLELFREHCLTVLPNPCSYFSCP